MTQAPSQPVLDKAIPVPGDAGLRSLARHAALIALVFGQFFVLATVIKEFQLVSVVFQRLVFLSVFAFVIHHLMPARARMPFFCVLSVLGIAVAAGCTRTEWATGLMTTAGVVGAGLLLIGLCHLPIPYAWRIVIIVLVGLGLMTARSLSHGGAADDGAMQAPWLLAAWPILGSMFMFRLIIYLYDLKHRAVPFSPARSFAYFFMLPNACFPLFPVIDYKTFCRTYESENRFQIYQVGLQWIVRGIVHLLLYRVITHHVQDHVSDADVVGLLSLSIFMVSTFLLYLNLSGQFHLIIGLLHLFGFNLPETHHNYILSSSFTDFWRRINIYWKDFILKLFFYPLMFRLKKLGATQALIVATIISFVATWFLHAYQWFWIRGDFLFTWQEGVFWSALCLLVIINSVKESKSGRQRTLGQRVKARAALTVALKTIGTFVVICIIWTIWSSPNFDDTLHLFAQARHFTVVDLLLVGGALALLGVTAVAMSGSKRVWVQGKGGGDAKLDLRQFRRLVLLTVLPTGLLYAAGQNERWQDHAPDSSLFVRSLKRPFSPSAEEQRERGYYEDLMKVERYSRVLWGAQNLRPAEAPHLYVTDAAEKTQDRLFVRMLPSQQVEFVGKTFSTNRWAFRDREYDKARAPGTFRIVVIGDSYPLGWGVHDDETFENVLEDRLNREWQPTSGVRYEILNFSQAGHGAIQKTIVLEEMAAPFRPDLVLYCATTSEQQWIADRAARAVTNGVALHYDAIKAIVEEAGVDAAMRRSKAKHLLMPHAPAMLNFAYTQIGSICDELEARPVWVFIPETVPSMRSLRVETMDTENMAKEAGFAIISLHDVYDDVTEQNLTVKSEDHHPNAHAHRAIANRLYQVFTEGEGVDLIRPALDATLQP